VASYEHARQMLHLPDSLQIPTTIRVSANISSHTIYCIETALDLDSTTAWDLARVIALGAR